MNQMFTKMNIESLMPSKYPNEYSNGRLDVNSIAPPKLLNGEPQKNFNSNELLKNIYEKRKKMRDWLVNTYNLCCGKIKDADDVGLTDIIFELPDIIMENSQYRHSDAIDYIIKNLRQEQIDVLKINNKKIFISWKYLELNKELNAKKN